MYNRYIELKQKIGKFAKENSYDRPKCEKKAERILNVYNFNKTFAKEKEKKVRNEDII